MSPSFIFLILVGAVIGAVVGYNKMNFRLKPSWREADREFPYQWRKILEERIEFYKRLDRTKKKEFEKKAHIFLLNVRVIGINTEVTDLDRMLVAASATIPIFGFPNWHYRDLFEVHIHPDKFQIPGTDKMARGLIGWGAMQGKMLLSRKALYEGFYNQEDQKNVAIHEFIHIVDKQDGEVDGVLDKVMNEIDIMPWLHIIHNKMDEINQGNSSIREYGAVNKAEFLAVVGEFFFESPDKMKAEHPALYAALDSIFNPKVASAFRYTKKYDKCPCGSGRRFGRCCMKNGANSLR